MADMMGWDADFYNSLSDTVRNVSLSDKEIYVLGNLLPMVAWSSRWSGDISALDLDSIRGNMEFTLLDEITVGVAMTCADVADCIETDATVKQSIIDNVLSSNGYTPNPSTDVSENEPPPVLTTTDKSQNLLSATLDCETQQAIAMGLARVIVKELHESSEDVLELLEYATNTVEAWANVTSSLPSSMTSVITIALDWVDWIIETFQELYVAAYTQAVEDELACAIYCHIITECSLTLTDLETIYQGEATIGTPPVGLIETIEFIYSIATSADKIAVAAFHYQILRLLSWGKFGAVSAPYLKAILKSSQGSDFSYQDLCTDCPPDTVPKTYWRLYIDAMTGQGRFRAENTWGDYNGSGWLSNAAATTAVRVGVTDLGGDYTIVGLGFEAQARGLTGVGGDLANFAGWQGIGYTGTLVGTPYSTSSIGTANNINNFRGGWVAAPTGLALVTSVRMQMNNVGLKTADNFVKVTKVVVIGQCLAGDVKPVGSEYWGNSIPSSVAEMFP